MARRPMKDNRELCAVAKLPAPSAPADAAAVSSGEGGRWGLVGRVVYLYDLCVNACSARRGGNWRSEGREKSLLRYAWAASGVVPFGWRLGSLGSEEDSEPAGRVDDDRVDSDGAGGGGGGVANEASTL